jgi:arylsulfatase A-like enzyme
MKLLTLLALTFSLTAQEPPNILLILADDLGYGDVTCYNAASKIATPHIDQLAREGMRFTDAHSPCTVCTPTRYSLMTGQMGFRIPRGGTVFSGAGGPSLITTERLTLPELLREKNYSTACIGKWHIGLTFYDKNGQAIHDGSPAAIERIDYSRRIDGGPLDHGFDHFFGTACCPTTDWLYAFIEGDRIPVPPTKKIDRSKLPDHPYSQDCREGFIADNFPMEEIDLVFLEKSRAFLQAHAKAKSGKPFFLFHSAQAVHLPSFAAERFKGKSKAGPHGDFILELDWIVGELMKTLTELGLAENTLVIFTSDNGPEIASAVHMRADHQHDPAHPWRGIKRDQWEGGHRVPFIVKWPGNIKANSTSDQLTSHTDVMATIASITDSKLPDNAAEDSFNMLPAYIGTASQPIRPYLLTQAFSTKFLSLRKGNWKYIDHPGSGGNNYEKNPDLKPYHLADTSPTQLYDLATDPGETKNLINAKPDIAKELKDLLEQSKASGRSR